MTVNEFFGAWTTDRVEHRLREAHRALRCASGGRSSSRMTWWPEKLGDKNTDYPDEQVTLPRLRASPGELDRMDETCGWLSLYLCRAAAVAASLPPDAGLVLWWRAGNVSQSKIAAMRKEMWTAEGVRYPPGGNSRPSLELIESRALLHFARELNAVYAPMDAGTLAIGGGK